jgi:hypothetical protein
LGVEKTLNCIGHPNFTITTTSGVIPIAVLKEESVSMDDINLYLAFVVRNLLFKNKKK